MSKENQPIRFRCPGCAATMRAKKTESGEKRKCPKCKVTFRIPKVAGSTQPPRKKKQPLVPVVCGVCNTRIYANLEQVGTSVECPDCFTQNLVKPPEKKVKPKPNLEKLGGYDVAPVQEIQIIKTQGEDKLEAAEEFVQQEIDAAPQMPDRPFIQGIFTYPFRMMVLPSLLGMAMAWTFFMLVVDGAWGMEGFASAVAPIVLAGAAFFFTLVVIPSFVTFQNIMENGANGDDETEIRPDGGLFTMVEWVGDVMPIVIAATVSCLPTLGLFHLFVALTSVDVPQRWIVETGLGYLAFLLFPLILLSMLENNSVLGVYSKQIWGSTTSRLGSWFKFGMIVTLLFGMLLAVNFAFQILREGDWTVATVSAMIFVMFCLVSTLAVYFRILGRLAFVLSSTKAGSKSIRRQADPAIA